MKKILVIVLVIILGFVAYVYLIKPQMNKIDVPEANNITPTENTLDTTSASNTDELNTAPNDSSVQNTETKQTPDKAVDSSSVISTEKEAMITAFFAFGKLLSGASPDPVIAYIKKSHPQDSAQLLASMNLSEDFAEVAPMLRAFGGFEDLTPSDFRAPTTVWKKQGNIVTVDVENKGTSMGYKAQFINQGGVWYVDMNK